jgi:MYXO-CTERM domain-containing protein
VAGNNGNPSPSCTFYSFDAELDAVAGLNEDDTAICPDRDGDGFRDRACGGNDCNDNDRAVNPAAVEDCAATRDLNCDGSTPMCPSNTTCVNGLCAPTCVEGGCPEGQTCITPDAGGNSYCLPSPCATVTCPAGQVCGPTGCQDPCANARCPTGQVCRGGACVDPCVGVLCPMRQHCEAGRCVANCPCVACATGATCNSSTGRCDAPGCGMLQCPPGALVDCRGATARCVQPCEGVTCPIGARCEMSTGNCVRDPCAGITCPTGMYCREGMCLDACQAGPDTTLCPSGEICQMGECVPGVIRDAGVARDAGSDAGTRRDAGARDAGVTPTDAGVVDTGVAADRGTSILPPSDRGCSCSTVGATRDVRGVLAAVLVGLVALVRRRRRD